VRGKGVSRDLSPDVNSTRYRFSHTSKSAFNLRRQ
jgi:hypothetical protein